MMLARVGAAAVSSMRAMSVGVLSWGVLSVGGLSLLAGLASSTGAHAQSGSDDLAYRVERLENQIRQMTGEIEELQYHNRQLEAEVNQMRGGARVTAAPSAPLARSAPRPVASGGTYYGSGRHGDAFDPSANPTAPGAPRALGSLPPQPPPPGTRPGMGPTPYGPSSSAADPGNARPAAGGAGSYPVATAAPPPSVPSGSPREVYDAGVVYMQRRDYPSAEATFRDFLTRYPNDRMAAQAQFNLGECLYQSQNYRDAADAFLQVSKKYQNYAKVPDAMLRLGQSLAAMNEKDLACAAFADGGKYPHTPSTVRQAIAREQKRARC